MGTAFSSRCAQRPHGGKQLILIVARKAVSLQGAQVSQESKGRFVILKIHDGFYGRLVQGVIRKVDGVGPRAKLVGQEPKIPKCMERHVKRFGVLHQGQ